MAEQEEEKPARPTDQEVEDKKQAEKDAARAEHAARRVGQTTN